MPCYDYHCEANGQTVEVRHGMNTVLTTWGEVCFAAQVPLGDTPFEAPVKKVLSPPAIAVPTSDSDLKAKGFTKLVKRDDGVYENVTRLDHESRYMKAGDESTLPDIKKRVSD